MNVPIRGLRSVRAGHRFRRISHRSSSGRRRTTRYLLRTGKVTTVNGSRKVARQRASATPISALSCQTAFQSIAQDCIASIRKNHMSARKGSAEAIHQIRVALTRLNVFYARHATSGSSIYSPSGPESGPWTRHGHAARLQKFSTYSQARLHSWRKRLVKKGGRISHSNATQRHHLRIKAKRYRYMLEAVATLGIANNFAKRKLAKRVQQALGDLRDLQCFVNHAENVASLHLDIQLGKNSYYGRRTRRSGC